MPEPEGWVSSTDPDHGGRYTVKVYRSRTEVADDGTWRHAEIRLEPDTDVPDYEAIVLTAMPEEGRSRGGRGGRGSAKASHIQRAANG